MDRRVLLASIFILFAVPACGQQPAASTPSLSSSPGISTLAFTGTPTPTSTVLPATLTPSPTLPSDKYGFINPSINDSSLKVFFEPILYYLENSPPTYSDNFDTDRNRWTSMDMPQELTGIVDGELSLHVISSEIQGKDCAGTTAAGVPDAQEFAMQIDGRINQGTYGWFMVLPHASNRELTINIEAGYDGGGSTWFGFADESNAVPKFTIPSPTDHYDLHETTRFTVIVKGDRRALLIDGKLFSWMITTSTREGGYFKALHIGTCGPDTEIRLDNFQWWDITKVH